MYYGIIETLGNIYTFLSRARGRCGDDAIKTIANGAMAMADNAKTVSNPGLKETADDVRDLDEVRLMRDHIEEMMVFQLSQEII